MKKIIIYVLIIIAVITVTYRYYESGGFNRLLDKYPDSQTAQYIDYFLANANFLMSDYDATIFKCQRVMNSYRVEKYKPAAYFLIGKATEEKMLGLAAIEIYKKVFAAYPTTYYGEMARKRVDFMQSIR